VSLLLIQNENDKIFNIRAKSFLNNFWKYIPCPKCRNDAKGYLSKNSIFSTSDAFSYTFDFHNNVNKKLNKPILTKDKYQQLYNSIDESIINRINGYTNYLKRNALRKGITKLNLQFYLDFIRYLQSSKKLFKLKY
jgi:predicted nucleic-acid-binding Zn-ribbon protein